MNLGFAELVIVFIGLVPGLLAVAAMIWAVVNLVEQKRRLATLEERVRTLEQRGQPGA